MFGPRITTVFRSKFRAIWFVVSVLVGVYFSVPHQSDKGDAADDKAAADAVAALVAPQQPAPSDHHVNPWAKQQP